MSAIRDYLEETRKREGDSGWLRRKPRATHPEILELVREFEAGGGFYDDAAERFVEERVGDLPEHRHHGHEDRHELTNQLGHEVYIARRNLDDEKALRVEQEAMLAGGFRRLEDESTVVDGDQYTIRVGTKYSGHEQINWGPEHQARATRVNGRLAWIPKGKRKPRTTLGPVLIREGWAA